jgi:hypothetical protein
MHVGGALATPRSCDVGGALAAPRSPAERINMAIQPNVLRGLPQSANLLRNDKTRWGASRTNQRTKKPRAPKGARFEMICCPRGYFFAAISPEPPHFAQFLPSLAASAQQPWAQALPSLAALAQQLACLAAAASAANAKLAANIEARNNGRRSLEDFIF